MSKPQRENRIVPPSNKLAVHKSRKRLNVDSAQHEMNHPHHHIPITSSSLAALSSPTNGGDDSHGFDDDSYEVASESGSKRARANVEGKPITTQVHPPSRVLHVRSLPTFTTEQELCTLLKPYGTIERCFITHHNKQAFIQLSNLEEAESIVAHSSSPPGFTLRGRQIFLQFSARKEVVTPAPVTATSSSSHHSSSSASSRDHHHTNSNTASSSSSAAGHPPSSSTGPSSHHSHDPSQSQPPQSHSTPNRILLLSVTNLRVNVTLDHIHQICKPSGRVCKIITFHKGHVFKALVQFDTIESAINAKSSLDGKDIYSGCCHMSVGYSSLTDLKITNTGPKARDFTKEENSFTNSTTEAVATQAFRLQQQQHQQQAQQQQQQMMLMNGYYAAPAGALNPYGLMAPNPYAIGYASPYPSPYGASTYTSVLAPQPVPSIAPSSIPPSGTVIGSNPSAFIAAAAAAAASHGVPSQSNPLVPSSSLPSATLPSTSGCVLIVSGLPVTSEITPDSLFTLFSVFGDVLRVKILFAKRDTAMIQYSTHPSCLLAIQMLHQLSLGGEKPLNVSLSKHETISMPKSTTATTTGDGGSSASSANAPAIDEASTLTQDFTTSKQHRYRGKLPMNTKNIHPPSQVLHVANLPDGLTEDELRTIFGHTQSQPIEIQFFTTDPHMAYVKLPTVRDAVMALMRTHNHRVGGRSIRVSFSGKDVQAFDTQQQQSKHSNSASTGHHSTNLSFNSQPMSTANSVPTSPTSSSARSIATTSVSNSDESPVNDDMSMEMNQEDVHGRTNENGL